MYRTPDLLVAGIQKMQAENKTSPQDILQAQDSLQAVVLETTKRIAVEMNEPWLSEPKFDAMLRSFSTAEFRLWPFIPPPWA